MTKLHTNIHRSLYIIRFYIDTYFSSFIYLRSFYINGFVSFYLERYLGERILVEEIKILFRDSDVLSFNFNGDSKALKAIAKFRTVVSRDLETQL